MQMIYLMAIKVYPEGSDMTLTGVVEPYFSQDFGPLRGESLDQVRLFVLAVNLPQCHELNFTQAALPVYTLVFYLCKRSALHLRSQARQVEPSRVSRGNNTRQLPEHQTFRRRISDERQRNLLTAGHDKPARCHCRLCG